MELESIRIIPIFKRLFSYLPLTGNGVKRGIEKQLEMLLKSLEKIGSHLERIPTHCVPAFFFNNFRPYLSGWNIPEFKETGGLVFGSAIDAPIYNSTGGSAAQSPIIQALDALLGVQHPPNPDGSPNYLYQIRKHIPKADRELILWVEGWGAEFSELCLKHKILHPFSNCLAQMIANRRLHSGIAWKFIKNEATKLSSATNTVGTGGTTYEKFLKATIEDTQRAKDDFENKFAILHKFSE